MKLFELFAMDSPDRDFNKLDTSDQSRIEDKVPVGREKDDPQGARRKDARRIALRLRMKADNQGQSTNTGDTPEQGPHGSSGMR